MLPHLQDKSCVVLSLNSKILNETSIIKSTKKFAMFSGVVDISLKNKFAYADKSITHTSQSVAIHHSQEAGVKPYQYAFGLNQYLLITFFKIIFYSLYEFFS